MQNISITIGFANIVGMIPILHIWKKEDLIDIIKSAGFHVGNRSPGIAKCSHNPRPVNV
jgi:hypothetical protein